MICFSAAAEVLAKKPNIVVIVADDMGFSDIGCYGSEIRTPNLDQLAGNGLRFTQFYNTARCWPSRAAILTGYYAQQVRRDSLPGVKSGNNGTRPAWARLLPEMLRPLGYRSYHSGKWHVDGQPLNTGFDHSYSLNDHDRYFNPKFHTLDDQPLPPVKPDSGYYSSTAIAQHALDMLDEHQAKHRDQPFFLYLAFTAPHFPLHALPGDIALYRDRYRAGWDVLRQERFERMKQLGLVNGAISQLDPTVWPDYNPSAAELREKISPGEVGRAVSWDSLTDEQKQFQPVKMAIHAAMIHRLDLEIGRVIAQLKAAGNFDDTLIFFVSDNGASAEQLIRGDLHDRTAPSGSAKSFLGLGPGWSSAANTPLRLHKSWVHEGGISTPLIVHWPNGLAAHGELRRNPGHLIDLAPTILELAGGRWPTNFAGQPVPPAPGKSLVPVFAKDGSITHDDFWWFHDGNRALRMGDWKLVADHNKPWELYDLSTDRAESTNLAGNYPGKVRELADRWTRKTEDFTALATKDLPPAAPNGNRRRPNIIFLMDDQHRWNTLGRSDPTVKTPTLDRLAREGILFDQAVCQAPMCIPSRYSMMLGLYPHQVGILSNGPGLRDEQLPCDPLPELLRKAGYQTAGFGKTHWLVAGASTRGFEVRYSSTDGEQGSIMMSKDNPAGFKRYNDEVEPYGDGEEWPAGYLGCTSKVPEADHRDGWTFNRCLEFLDQGRDAQRPLFLYLSFMKPHAGANVPPGYEDLYKLEDMPVPEQPSLEQVEPCHATGNDRQEMYRSFWSQATKAQWQQMVLRYRANCSWIDSLFGRVMDKLRAKGLLENCLIVYVSDHGEMLGERYYRFNKYCLYDGSVRVPMILSGTAIPAGKRGVVDHRMAEEVDFYPTLAKIAGLPKISGKPGENLLGPSSRKAGFCEYSDRPGVVSFMWRTSQRKLILTFPKDSLQSGALQLAAVTAGEFYDLTTDMREWYNIYGQPGGRVEQERMSAELIAHLNDVALKKINRRQ